VAYNMSSLMYLYAHQLFPYVLYIFTYFLYVGSLPDEIYTIINKISAKKSPGHDLIMNYIVKNLTRKAIIFLSHLYNAILRLSFFPSTWKHSIVVLILKPNKPPENPASYRPISLLPTLSKIFEKFS